MDYSVTTTGYDACFNDVNQETKYSIGDDILISYHMGFVWKVLNQFMIGLHEYYDVFEVSNYYYNLIGDL